MTHLRVGVKYRIAMSDLATPEAQGDGWRYYSGLVVPDTAMAAGKEMLWLAHESHGQPWTRVPTKTLPGAQGFHVTGIEFGTYHHRTDVLENLDTWGRVGHLREVLAVMRKMRSPDQPRTLFINELEDGHDVPKHTDVRDGKVLAVTMTGIAELLVWDAHGGGPHKFDLTPGDGFEVDNLDPRSAHAIVNHTIDGPRVSGAL